MPTVQEALQAAGIPGDAFRIEVGTLREIAQSSLADRTPVAGGVQITNPLPGTGHVSSCSFVISFQWRDWNTFAFTPDYYGIMPDHCSGIRGSVDTLPWSQSNAQNRFIGREVFTPAPYTGGDCPGTDTCIVDLTVLKITDSAVTQSMNAQRGLIAWPNLGDSTFTFSSYMNDVGPVAGTPPDNILAAWGSVPDVANRTGFDRPA